MQRPDWYPRLVNTFEIRLFGDPVLRQRAPEVTELDGDLARLVDTMIETMHAAPGIGLAAPQVGVQKRLYTYDIGEGPGVVINPEIVESSGEWVYDEGCLSVPGLSFEIVRPKLVTVRGMDLDGNDVVIEGDELMGRLIQHEIDHLDGVLLLDRLEKAARKEAMRELRRQVEAGTLGAMTDEDTGRRL
ncbi:MAG: peptide deformylase [Actinobacteria bacterium]|nr:peptide deformylase [Actinomycetota bacterium]